MTYIVLVLNDVNGEVLHTPQSIDDCISALFLGKSCNLYNYKGLDKKTELLNKALDTYDGNVIITVSYYNY